MVVWEIGAVMVVVGEISRLSSAEGPAVEARIGPGLLSWTRVACRPSPSLWATESIFVPLSVKR